MDFWDLENELIADIKKRGAIVEYNNGGGQKGQKKNPQNPCKHYNF